MSFILAKHLNTCKRLCIGQLYLMLAAEHTEMTSAEDISAMQSELRENKKAEASPPRRMEKPTANNKVNNASADNRISQDTPVVKGNSMQNAGMQDRMGRNEFYLGETSEYLQAAMHLNRKQEFQEVNRIATIFGKDTNPYNRIIDQALRGNLLAYSKKRSRKAASFSWAEIAQGEHSPRLRHYGTTK